MPSNFNDTWLPRIMRAGGEKLQNLLGPDMSKAEEFRKAQEEEARLREMLAYRTWFNPNGPSEGNSEKQLYGGVQPQTLGQRWPMEAKQKMLARLLMENAPETMPGGGAGTF